MIKFAVVVGLGIVVCCIRLVSDVGLFDRLIGCIEDEVYVGKCGINS